MNHNETIEIIAKSKREGGKILITLSCRKGKQEGKIHATGGINMRNEKTTYPPPIGVSQSA